MRWDKKIQSCHGNVQLLNIPIHQDPVWTLIATIIQSVTRVGQEQDRSNPEGTFKTNYQNQTCGSEIAANESVLVLTLQYGTATFICIKKETAVILRAAYTNADISKPVLTLLLTSPTHLTAHCRHHLLYKAKSILMYIYIFKGQCFVCKSSRGGLFSLLLMVLQAKTLKWKSHRMV